jgi:chromosome partitioning protein
MATIVAVANQKGGVAKSTTAVAVSAALADAGQRVITVDCDPQATASALTGFDLRPAYTSLDTPVRAYIAGAPAALSAALVPLEPRWGLIPAHIDMAKLELDLFHADSREFVLRDLLATLADSADWIILDCPPALGMLTINALCAADRVLVPQIPDLVSARGLKDLADTVRRLQRPRLNPYLTWAGVVLTRVRAHLKQHQAMREQIATFCQSRHIPFLSAPNEVERETNPDRYIEIADTIVVAKAADEGLAVSRYPGQHEAKAGYRKLAAWLLAGEEPAHG